VQSLFQAPSADELAELDQRAESLKTQIDALKQENNALSAGMTNLIHSFFMRCRGSKAAKYANG